MSQHIFDESESNSTSKGIISLKKHFDFFIKNQYSKNKDVSNAVFFDKLTVKDIDDRLVGHFCNYLLDAKSFAKRKDKEFLSYATVS